jgi:hypothetical protein
MAAGRLAQCLRESAFRARLKRCSFDFVPGSGTPSSTHRPHWGRRNGRPKSVEPQDNKSPQRNSTRGSPTEISPCRTRSRSHHPAPRAQGLRSRPRKRRASDSLTGFRGGEQQKGENAAGPAHDAGLIPSTRERVSPDAVTSSRGFRCEGRPRGRFGGCRRTHRLVAGGTAAFRARRCRA